MRRFIFVIAVSVMWFASTTAAQAQEYPNRPIRLLVGVPAGASIDVGARIIAGKLSESPGRPVVVENRLGVNGLIADDLLAKSAPDGYTLLLSTLGPYAIFTSLFKKLPYDPVKDFAPISLVEKSTLVLVTNLSVPVKSLAEFIAYAKTNPGKISYASPGSGSPIHLAMELHRMGRNPRHQHQRASQRTRSPRSSSGRR